MSNRIQEEIQEENEGEQQRTKLKKKQHGGEQSGVKVSQYGSYAARQEDQFNNALNVSATSMGMNSISSNPQYSYMQQMAQHMGYHPPGMGMPFGYGGAPFYQDMEVYPHKKG